MMMFFVSVSYVEEEEEESAKVVGVSQKNVAKKWNNILQIIS